MKLEELGMHRSAIGGTLPTIYCDGKHDDREGLIALANSLKVNNPHGVKFDGKVLRVPAGLKVTAQSVYRKGGTLIPVEAAE
jgi:hypothetical protein